MSTAPLEALPPDELVSLRDQLRSRLDQLRAADLNLDLTRGKPAADQLDLSNPLDGILQGDYLAADGTDTRNYGGLRGLPEARELGAEILGVNPEQIIAGGNSSLFLMYIVLEVALRDDLWGPGSGWSTDSQPHGAPAHGRPIRMLAPVPGYDRHFTICERFGIEMVNVPVTDTGPDLEAIKELLASDPSIKGIWCVPKYSNPTGCTYSDAVVDEIARLPQLAGPDFLVMWDNAYGVHDLELPTQALKNILAEAEAAGTADHIALFGSTSKITFAGAGVGFVGGTPALLGAVENRFAAMTVGHDKVNQLRHARFLKGRVPEHMQAHANLLRGKFAVVQDRLVSELGPLDVATWTQPKGGYFVSVDTRPGLASRVVELAAETGVKLTPAGATFPYGRDPEDRNIRIAPTFPTLDDVDAAMEVFTLCVRLAAAEQLIQRGASS